MIVVDTSVWIDHLRATEPLLESLLEKGRAAVHPFVLAEIALGAIANRDIVLTELRRAPQVLVARAPEMLVFMEANALHGIGIGYVDVHLLASAQLTLDGRVWTRDKRLHAAALRLGLAMTG